MRTAVYAGSFDPPTNGHLWMIERGLEMFDHLIVAIGDQSLEALLVQCRGTAGLATGLHPACERLVIAHFDNRYLVDYARKRARNTAARHPLAP